MLKDLLPSLLITNLLAFCFSVHAQQRYLFVHTAKDQSTGGLSKINITDLMPSAIDTPPDLKLGVDSATRVYASKIYLVQKDLSRVLVFDGNQGFQWTHAFLSDPGANPTDIKLVNAQKVYISQNSSNNLLVVNPTNNTILKRVNLRNTVPTPCVTSLLSDQMALIGNKLFVTMLARCKQTNWDFYGNYLAVLQTDDDAVIQSKEMFQTTRGTTKLFTKEISQEVRLIAGFRTAWPNFDDFCGFGLIESISLNVPWSQSWEDGFSATERVILARDFVPLPQTPLICYQQDVGNPFQLNGYIHQLADGFEENKLFAIVRRSQRDVLLQYDILTGEKQELFDSAPNTQIDVLSDASSGLIFLAENSEDLSGIRVFNSTGTEQKVIRLPSPGRPISMDISSAEEKPGSRENVLGIELYPNPTHGPLTASIRSSSPRRCKVSTFDTSGREVATESFYVYKTEQLQPLDLSRFDAAGYVLQFTCENHRPIAKRVVKVTL